MPGETETDFSQAILEEARQDAENILDLARREAERILAGAREELERAYQAESPKAATQVANTRYKQIIAAVELEARKQGLLTRERLIAEVWQQVADRLRGVRNEAPYPDLLKRLAREGISALDGNQFEIIVAPEDRQLITLEFLQELSEQTATTLSLSEESEPEMTGVIVRRADKRVRYDNSLQGILQRQENVVRLEIAQRLFEEHEPT